jgi:hypothetical protein
LKCQQFPCVAQLQQFKDHQAQYGVDEPQFRHRRDLPVEYISVLAIVLPDDVLTCYAILQLEVLHCMLQ